jgi:hypothetical protein
LTSGKAKLRVKRGKREKEVLGNLCLFYEGVKGKRALKQGKF